MLHIPCWNDYFNAGGTKEDPIRNMIKLELTNISDNGGPFSLTVVCVFVSSARGITI